MTDLELSKWLEPIKGPVVVLDCALASAPFLNRLSAANRIVVTATRSGAETNYARFGRFLSEAITDPQADLDKDGQVSLLEAYLTASRRVEDYYRRAQRMAERDGAALPFTCAASSAMPSSRSTASACAAKASLSSIRSIDRGST